VSADADPSTGYVIYDSVNNLGWSALGGTSGAAPLWAAVLAVDDSTNGNRAGYGALNPALKPCDIFVGIDLVGIALSGIDLVGADVAHALSVPRSHSCERKQGKLLSIDHVATTPQEKARLHQDSTADAIEMEASGVAATAAASHIPCYAIKVVTDTATETFPLNFNLLRDAEGRFSRPKIIAATFRRPRAIPALINLNQRCNQAAQALGDFLADARF